MARRIKMSPEERKARQRAGIKRWHRHVDYQVDELFAYFDAGSDPNHLSPDPSEFTQAYYDRYGEHLPLIYARAHTEFGERYGSKINWEDAGCGEFGPSERSDHRSVEEQVDEMCALVDAYYDSQTPEQRAPRESTNSEELKPEDDFDMPF